MTERQRLRIRQLKQKIIDIQTYHRKVMHSRYCDIYFLKQQLKTKLAGAKLI